MRKYNCGALSHSFHIVAAIVTSPKVKNIFAAFFIGTVP